MAVGKGERDIAVRGLAPLLHLVTSIIRSKRNIVRCQENGSIISPSMETVMAFIEFMLDWIG